MFWRAFLFRDQHFLCILFFPLFHFLSIFIQYFSGNPKYGQKLYRQPKILLFIIPMSIGINIFLGLYWCIFSLSEILKDLFAVDIYSSLIYKYFV